MSTIAANDPLYPGLGPPSASLSARGPTGTGRPLSEAAGTFSAVFHSIEESAADWLAEEELSSETGLALSAEGIAQADTPNAPISEFGLPTAGAAGTGAQSVAGTAPLPHDALDRHVRPVPKTVDGAPLPVGDEMPVGALQGYAAPQESHGGGEWAPPKREGTLAQTRGGAAPGLAVGPGMPGKASHFELVQHVEFDPESESKIILRRDVGSHAGLSAIAQMGAGHLHATLMATRLPEYPDLVFRDAFPQPDMPGQVIEIGVGKEGVTQEVFDISEWRVSVSAGPNSANQSVSSLPRTDLPQALAQQIAAAVRSTDIGKPVIDLRLAPEELGRVRLRLTSHEGIITVNMVAERPETLDLLRRHVDALARGLLDVGYQEARFSFAGRDPRDQASKASVARGWHHHEDQGFSLIPERIEAPALLSSAMTGTRINVLI